MHVNSEKCDICIFCSTIRVIYRALWDKQNDQKSKQKPELKTLKPKSMFLATIQVKDEVIVCAWILSSQFEYLRLNQVISSAKHVYDIVWEYCSGWQIFVTCVLDQKHIPIKIYQQFFMNATEWKERTKMFAVYSWHSHANVRRLGKNKKKNNNTYAGNLFRMQSRENYYQR